MGISSRPGYSGKYMERLGLHETSHGLFFNGVQNHLEVFHGSISMERFTRIHSPHPSATPDPKPETLSTSKASSPSDMVRKLCCSQALWTLLVSGLGTGVYRGVDSKKLVYRFDKQYST